ncbi:type VI secretion system Vgr family protein [Pseudomonas sp. JUb96]|uniref:type VI secretion system Vgr family protein n=1 Tax=Pseudomonas sp. JUb96 TaxID=2940539 RepID=UPI00222645CC|nr:type VI secretion system tip protein TssI/VgrG [Pseudomonas sp. JUb96]MCW2271676.1 type VI secretion system secreted protein VgrG [Pseudomonas sp. JUb96]
MPRQSDLRFTFQPLASEAQFEVIDFDLEEGLSQPFRLALTLSSHDPDIAFAGLLDNPARFTLWQGEYAVRHVHGLVSRLTVGTSGFRRTRYQVLVEPTLARLALCSDWRIFQALSVPQIIDKVLGQHRIFDRKLITTATYSPREYCVQAGETDLQFLARLAAEEGLLYTFEHSASGHRLVFTDRVLGLGQIGPDDDREVRYEASPGGDQPLPALWQFNYTEQVRTTRQVQRDYTFTHPRYTQQHEATGQELQRQANRYERYDYPGRYKRDAVGKPFTQTRLLALRNDARLAEAVGDNPRLQPGLGFDLGGHPREAFNSHWRALRINHQGVQHDSQEEDASDASQGTHYQQTAWLINGRVDWKADLPPKPRIDGPQMATVVGPPNEEIYCDEWGRVKLSFPWDRQSKHDATSSCWVRVSQGWAGTTWGAMAIPRIGQEVIVSYVDGDPDQPIVTGRTYRATNLPPYELPKHKTRMTLKSQTHKGRGSNELRFEDELGHEEVFIHAEKDQNNVVKHNETTRVGNDRSERVDQDERVEIGRDRFEVVGNDEQVTIGQDRHNDIGRDDSLSIARHHTITTAQDRTETVGNHRRDTTTANHWVEIGGHLEQRVAGHVDLEAGQAIRHRTQEYEIQVAQRMVIKAPGGTLRLDEAGITLDGVAIHINGPIRQSPEGGTHAFTLSGIPNPGEPVCLSCMLKAIEEGRSVIRLQGASA